MNKLSDKDLKYIREGLNLLKTEFSTMMDDNSDSMVREIIDIDLLEEKLFKLFQKVSPDGFVLKGVAEPNDSAVGTRKDLNLPKGS